MDDGRRDTLYHGTSERNAKRILREGLRADRMRRDDESGKFAFLTHSKEHATAFAPGGDSGPPARGQRPVVLEVKAPRLIQDRYRTDLGEYVRSPGVIPPRYIRRVP